MSNFPENISSLYVPPIWKFKNLANKYINSEKKIYDLNQAVPNYLPPDTIKEALKRELDSKTYPFYTTDEGLLELREAISSEFADLYDNKIVSNNICTVAGANNAFYSVISTVCKAGDEIILLSPYYFNHYMAAKILSVEPVEVLLDEKTNFALLFDEIKGAISSKTRAIVFVNPSNPTGVSYSQADVDKLYELCQRNKIYLISDEVYNYFHSSYPKPASVINCCNFTEYSVSIHSYSKTFSLTGFRVGFIVASETFLNHFLKVQDTNIICAPRIAQIAALEGLKKAKSWLNEKINDMWDREKAFVKCFKQKTSCFSLLSSGAFFIYLKFDIETKAEDLCLSFVRDENIVMLPGAYFGSRQERTIRIALGNITFEEMPTVIDKIHNYSY